MEGDTALHVAAREGHLGVLKVLIPQMQAGDPERGKNAAELLGMTNKARNTALHEAVINHHPHVVEFLINQDPRYQYVANEEGKTPLYIAAEEGFGDLVRMIIDKCSSPAHRGINRRTALHAAIFLNDPGSYWTDPLIFLFQHYSNHIHPKRRLWFCFDTSLLYVFCPFVNFISNDKEDTGMEA